MDTKMVLQELKEEIATEMLKRYNASNLQAFEVSGFILEIVDKKISQCDGE